MEDKYEDDGISLGELFSVMLNRKLVILVSTAIVFILGVIGVMFFYNPGQRTLSGFYKYKDTSLNEGSLYDGSLYSFEEIITVEGLNEVKKSNKDFANIDVENIVKHNALTIRYEIERETLSNNETIIKKEGFLVNVLVKYFKNSEEALAFADAVVNQPILMNEKLFRNIKNDNNIDAFNEALTYEAKLQYIDDQIKYVHDIYDNLIEKFGDIVPKSNTRTEKLSTYKQQLDDYFKDRKTSVLSNQIRENGYVLDFETTAFSLKSQRETLERELLVNYGEVNPSTGKRDGGLLAELTNQRDLLLSQVTSGNLQTAEINKFNDQIVTLTNRRFEIEDSLHLIDMKLDSKDKVTVGNAKYDASYVQGLATFEGKINEYMNKLKEFTALASSVENEVLTNNAMVLYDVSSKLEATGGLSIMIAAVIFVVLGAGVGVAINLILDKDMLKQEYLVEKRVLTKKKIQEKLESLK